MLFRLINTVLELYKLLLLVYLVLNLLRVRPNRWTKLLASAVEPVVVPVRTFLRERLPAEWQRFDWSVVAVYLLISLAQGILRILL